LISRIDHILVDLGSLRSQLPFDTRCKTSLVNASYVEAIDAALWEQTQNGSRYNLALKDCLQFLNACKRELDLSVPVMNSWAKFCADNGISPPPSSAPSNGQTKMSIADMSHKRRNLVSSVHAQLDVCTKKIDGDMYSYLRIPKSDVDSYAKRLDSSFWDMAKEDLEVYSEIMSDCLTALAKCQEAIEQKPRQDVAPWVNFLSHHFLEKGYAIDPALRHVFTEPTSANIGATKTGFTDVDPDTTSADVPSMDHGPTNIDYMDVSSKDVSLTITAVTNAPNTFTPATNAHSMNTLSTASTATNTLPTTMTSTNTLSAGNTFAASGSMNTTPLDGIFKDGISHTGPNTAIWKMPEPHEPLSMNPAKGPPKPKSSNVLKNLKSRASKSYNKFVPPSSAGLLRAASGAQDINVVGGSFKKAKSADDNSLDVVSVETASANNTFMITTPMDATFKDSTFRTGYAKSPRERPDQDYSRDEAIDPKVKASAEEMEKRKVRAPRSPRKIMAQPVPVVSGPSFFGPATSATQQFQSPFPTNIFDSTSYTPVKAEIFPVPEQQSSAIPKLGGRPDCTSSSKPPVPSGMAGSQFSFGDPSAPRVSISFMQNLPISIFPEVTPMASNPITRTSSTIAVLPSSTTTKSVDSSLAETAQLVLKKHTHKSLELGASPLEKPSISKRHTDGPTEKPTFPNAGNEALAKPQVPASTSKHVAFAESYKEPAAAGNFMIEEYVAAPMGISSIERTTPPVPEAEDKKNEIIDNADLSKPVIVMSKTEPSNTRPAASQMQFMELLTMISTIQTSQKKAEQLLEVSLDNEKTHRNLCDTLAQELTDLKLQF
jgi:hypothetical protein